MQELNESDIAKAAREVEEIILEQLEKLDEEEHIFTKEFEDKMRQFIKNEKHLKSARLTRKIGVAILIIGIVGSLSISVEAVRIRVIEFITEVFEKFTSISYQKYEEKYNDDIEVSYLPQYIPEGFEVIEEEQIFNDRYITYQNNLGEEILLRQIEIDANNMIIDTEGAHIEEIILEDRIIYYYENKGIKNMMWIQGEYQLVISSEIDKQELIKMSISIK
ncbi:MAG: DUF4367 domain-containing protein [Clostridiales bacterium]|nr:DUF4367 domain-containing protein [Clostridiales bacterium]MDU6975617.1 DUF4367 domain-containing protein [Clostridiales bacterium]